MYLDKVDICTNGKTISKYIFELILEFRYEFGNDYSDQKVLLSDSIYHYTSIPSLLAILKSDSFRLSNLKYCNDWSEGQWGKFDQSVLNCIETIENKKENDLAEYDDYILSLCYKDDVLSQWRGYCPFGGASIGLNFSQPKGSETTKTFLNSRKCLFSIVEKAYPNNGCYELLSSAAIPLIYLEPNTQSNGITPIIDQFRNWLDKTYSNLESHQKKILMRSLVPYLKAPGFIEEKEIRIVVPNKKERFDKCIDYRIKEDKQIVPYMDIRFDNIGDTKKSIFFSETQILQMIEDARSTGVLIVPSCKNQEDIFNKIGKKLDGAKDSIVKTIKIVCAGHLPVTSIRIGPTHNRGQVLEQVNNLKKSMYWLSRVDVNVSSIPYIPPNE